MTTDSVEDIKNTLARLRREHRDLDDLVSRIPSYDLLQLQRLKKRKLALKDQITLLENRLLPDIIA